MARPSLSARTELRTSPALLGLARLLELPGLGLHAAVRAELAANPALEEVETTGPCPRCGAPAAAGWCPRCVGTTQDSSAADDDGDAPFDHVAAPRSLADALLEGLRAALPEAEHPVALALVGSLDDRGFLTERPAAIAAGLGVARGRVEAALALLRDLGPPGLAARDPRECLLAQLDALAAAGITCPHAREIVADHLDDLAAHRHHRIARRLRVPSAAVERAREFIRDRLWPHPAAAAEETFPAGEVRRTYPFPDLAIRPSGPTFAVEVLLSPDRWLRPNPAYRDLARRAASLSPEDRDHVERHLDRARTFVRNLRRRERTLRRIGEAVVARQEPFLRHGPAHLAPMTRLQVAADLDLHVSTVSRAVLEKVALLPNGAPWPLPDLFGAAGGLPDVLRDLVAGETAPLPDHELARLLTARGYPVARRTVAKHRDHLGIPPHHARRRADAKSPPSPRSRGEGGLGG